MTKQIFLAEIIGDDYKNWQKGETILLDSATGTGKTSLCFKLADEAQKNNEHILYITSRSAKLEEFIKDTKDFPNVFYYSTFQKLEQEIAYGNTTILERYCKCRYLFIDECHYFSDDVAIPDSNASSSEEWLRLIPQTPIKIYASATATKYFDFLRDNVGVNEDHVYSTVKNYDYVKKCYIYEKKSCITIIDNILANEPDSKVLVFVNNTSRMNEFANHYGYEVADYLCSSSTSDNYLRKVCNMTNRTTTEIKKRILFATKAIDIGINIKDETLKHIICEMYEPNTIIQCLGRKRPVDENDMCYFYICNQDEKTLTSFANKSRKHLSEYREYVANPERFINKRRNDRSLNKGGSVFILTPGNDNVQIDLARVRKYEEDVNFYDQVAKIGFADTIKEYVKELSAKIEIYDDKVSFVIEHLKTLEGIRFYGEDKHKVSEFFSSLIKNKRTFGINIINAWLDEYIGDRYGMRFVSMTDNRPTNKDNSVNPFYKLKYWILKENL